MNMFPTPLAGSYTARTRNFDGTFNTFYTSCWVLGESDKIYSIRVTTPICGHRANDTLTVRKHNVRLKDAAPKPSAPVRHDYSEAWWNK